MRLRSFAPLALAVSLALPSVFEAQGNNPYLLPVPTADMLGGQMGRTQPGVAASSPVGYGPSQGDIFAGIGYQAKATNGEQDGAISVGAGFLSPYESVGIEAVLTSLSTIRSGFGSRMVGALKVHRNVSGWGLGLGLEGVYLNGNDFDTKPSVYLAATRGFTLRQAETFSAATLNVGLGNGRFQSAEDFAADKSGIGVFLSGSVRVNEWSSAILDYTGAQVNLAMSFSPLKNLPLIVTPSLNDITGEAGDRARLSIGAGMSWKY